MDQVTLSIIVATVLLFVGLFIGMHIGVVLAFAGMVGIIIFTGRVSDAALRMPLTQGLEVATNYGFIVIPLFLLLGNFAAMIGITQDLFGAANRWFGQLRGGLAVTTVVTCAGMAAITGSSVSTALAMTKIALPELRRYGYKDELSVGAITVGGTLAIMIPPSITLVLFGIFSDQSIGKLLIAGYLPGILTALLYIILIIIRCHINPSLAPTSPKFSWREKLASVWGVLPFFCIILGIMLGILLGIATPVEASGVGCVLVLLMGLIRRRIQINVLLESLREAAVGSASVMFLIIGAFIFGKFLALSGVSEAVTRSILGWALPPFLLFMVFTGIYLILGCFLEAGSIMALTVPLFMPVITAVGWSPIWFGIVVVSLMEVAAVTPPVGLNLYAVKAAQPDLPLPLIYASCVPFWLMNLVAITILYLLPDIALILPSLMVG